MKRENSSYCKNYAFCIRCLKGLEAFPQIVSDEPLAGEGGIREGVCSLNCSKSPKAALWHVCAPVINQVEENNTFSGILKANGQFHEHRESFLADWVQVRAVLSKLDRETPDVRGAEEDSNRCLLPCCLTPARLWSATEDCPSPGSLPHHHRHRF